MAIMVQCHKCSTVLELDEGFRGGVCRCNACGTLLQVPSEIGSGTARSRPASPSAQFGGIIRPSSPDKDPGLSGSGLANRTGRPEQPIGSSGAFAGSGVRSRSPALNRRGGSPIGSRMEDIPRSTIPTVKVEEIKHSNRRLDPLILWSLIGLAVVFVVAGALIIWQILGQQRSSARKAASQEQLIRHSTNPSGIAGGPRFLGIPLTGRKILFSLDGSSANADSFNYVAAGVQQAVAMLALDQKFRIAVWREKKLTVLPGHGWLSRSDVINVNAVIQRLANMVTYGSSDPIKSMTTSLALGANQVIFVTAKFELPDDLVAKVEAARSPGQRIDTISVNGARKELEKLANDCDGKFRKYSDDALSSMTTGN